MTKKPSQKISPQLNCQLTSRQHHNDGENHFIVSVGCDVAKADGAEPGKDKIEGRAVDALILEEEREKRIW